MGLKGCGFSSFRSQNRTEFSISFFIFGLVFLLLDLGILLVYPYTVSSYNNSSYGLIFVIIFLVLLTIGFVFEMAKGALKINSKQTGYLESSNLEVNLPKNKLNLYNRRGHYISPATTSSGKRFYSTQRAQPSPIVLAKKQRSSQDDFWKKVNSSDMSDNDNPFIIVNNFLKKYSKDGEAKYPINQQLIDSILSRHIPNFNLTAEEFDILINIIPVRLELPIEDKDVLVKLVGKYARNGVRGIAGVYVFTNKTNGYSYVGSSISLSNRLATGYLGPKLGNRKIDLAIKDAGLDSFYLDLYILPKRLVENLDNTVDDTFFSKKKCLTLALEQVLLFFFKKKRKLILSIMY